MNRPNSEQLHDLCDKYALSVAEEIMEESKRKWGDPGAGTALMLCAGTGSYLIIGAAYAATKKMGEQLAIELIDASLLNLSKRMQEHGLNIKITVVRKDG